MNKRRNETPDDAPAMAQIWNTYDLDSPATIETAAIDPHTMRKPIQAIFPTMPKLENEADGRLLGYAYAHEERARGKGTHVGIHR